MQAVVNRVRVVLVAGVAARATIRAAWASLPRARTMISVAQRLQLLRRLAGLCAVMVLAVTSLSAYLRLDKAGFGCADWPQCYGQSLRQLQQGVAVSAEVQTATAAARLAHRVVAVIALLLVLLMVAVCFSGGPVLRAEGAMALALLVLALALAVLGRWSSMARVPAVTLGNLLGGFAMLALCARLALAGLALDEPVRTPKLRGWVLVALCMLVAQLALGGLVSASFAGLSCGTWADCMQAARTIGWDTGWDTLNPWREPVLSALPPVNPDGALAHALHRCLAVAVVLVVLPLAVVAWRHGRRRSAAALMFILVAQVAVGSAMVLGSLPLVLALLHNLLGAGLLTALVLLL